MNIICLPQVKLLWYNLGQAKKNKNEYVEVQEKTQINHIFINQSNTAHVRPPMEPIEKLDDTMVFTKMKASRFDSLQRCKYKAYS